MNESASYWACPWPCCRRRSLQDLTQYRSSSPLQLLQPIFRVELSDGNRTRTVSLGTDSLQGHSPRWLRARVMARVPFRTRMSVDLLERYVGFACPATVFEHGAGDGNRTRTVSLGRVLISPCFRVLQRYWRPQLAPGDPYRPGLVAVCGPVLSQPGLEQRGHPVGGEGRSSVAPDGACLRS